MPKLNDTQLILLSTAAQRDTGSFYPLPDTITGDDQRTAKAIDALVKRGFVEERETSDKPSICRSDDGAGFGMFLTEAGRAAIDDGDAGRAGDASQPAVAPTPRVSKSSMVLDLLRRANGATLPELIEATGWLPHTTRAALTGLRKKGHAIERTRRGSDTCYTIAA
jgi:DNA-binding MarR family transcriptional regulator